MKEAFVDLQTLSEQTKAYADLELQSYLSSLPPAQQAAFVSSQIGGAISAVEAEKQSKYIDVSDKLKGLDANVGAAMYYLTRTRDLNNMATQVQAVTEKQLDVIDKNRDVSVRQNEINEWSNSNKLDTLYFLQLLFVNLSFIGVVLFFKVLGLVSESLFKFITILSVIILIVALVFRYRYTAVARDTRYWSKSKFGKQPDVIGASVNLDCPAQ